MNAVPMSNHFIHIKGARQNNLKGFDLRLPLHELIVITGVSGSGKSSLAFDTVYAEGQRRYVETFSPYARQFLDRMDKPQVERVDGIPPSIAIDQTNPVRTSRSTVGTMTELNDHLKLLFARAARLYCRDCAQPVTRDDANSIFEHLLGLAAHADAAMVMVTFPVTVPENFSEQEVRELLARQGYGRIHRQRGSRLDVVQDRVRASAAQRDRLVEALEAALKYGQGRVSVYPLDADRKPGKPWHFSAGLHCAECDIDYAEPISNLFSFNSPVGACPTCRGFGRTMGIDYDLVVPDGTKTLAEGAIKPWQTDSYIECQADLTRFARLRDVPLDVPWNKLTKAHQQWVLEGEGKWSDGKWYGARRFFAWLETKSYKMHIRVLLSKYRAYDACPDCAGARLKTAALLWRVGDEQDAARVLPVEQRFSPADIGCTSARFRALPGLTLHDVMQLPIKRCREFFEHIHLPTPMDQAADVLLGEIRARLRYLGQVGLDYLSLDRQSRTLSGGEVQRINLTTALGTSLVNTLFVLDEPSVGLHPRDMQRVVSILHQLRDAGNSLLVVEHDPQVMLAADRVLDFGPGPGEQGGEVVFFGTPKQLLRSRRSLTADYLAGRATVGGDARRRAEPLSSAHAAIQICGAAENNLKAIDVSIPLHRLVCITGVSGSGKSTLIQDVLYKALRKLKGRPVEPAGAHRAIRGHKRIDGVVMVDQSPIGKTTRSNPASYVGALDAIRKLFAAQPLARARDYSAGTFSFNSGTGRCPTCGGNGFEHVEMQFLSDVYIRCPDCDGTRYRPEVLEVKLLPSAGGMAAPVSIAGVLEMTVSEAVTWFADHAEIVRVLGPLQAVGLSYLRLGQPVPTLSGGEAQRLKLAGHLARARGAKSDGATLFIFDEPTTGLHFDDIARLLRAFDALLEQGHSLVVIEHNLDVVGAADWIVDLGPEGGDAGGSVVYAGTPEALMRASSSHTGVALRQYQRARGLAASAAQVVDVGKPKSISSTPKAGTAIRIRNAREHNLRGIDVDIPLDKFTVITGVSGSGKSTLAFDILFGEGQRRYLESLNAYTRQFVQPSARPDVDAITGIPPTVAIEQRTSRGGRKSTVATMTEIYHFLRLLFVKLGTQYCPDCDIPIEAQSAEAILARILQQFRGRQVALYAPLVVARKGYYTELAQWAASKGYAQLRVDGAMTPTEPWPRLDRFREHSIDLPVASMAISAKTEAELRAVLTRALELGKGVVEVQTLQKRSRAAANNAGCVVFSVHRACPGCGRSFKELDPRLFSYNSKHGWCEHCYGTGLLLPGFDAEQSGEEIQWNLWWEGEERTCPSCDGHRLRAEALAVRVDGRSIGGYTRLTVEQARSAFGALRLRGRAGEIGRDIIPELRSRLSFLGEVGLGYLSLDRSAPTLSGGEAQRIRLAAQLGSNLRGVCYILDEPTIGLHPRDNRMLLATLGKLEAKGNTIVVVEHDEDTIRRAEHVIDLGPGAGVDGGCLVATGTLKSIMAAPDSVTGRFLSTPLRHPLQRQRPVGTRQPALRIVGADLHNLRHLNARFPLQRLLCVTGVSGSGKSTLVRQVLRENLQRLLSRGKRRKATSVPLVGCRELRGWEMVGRVLEVDQTPIGKTPRSCPATYVGFWDQVRRLYADTTEARIRAFGPSRFSFNVKGGRCPACDGQGVKRIEMSFLPDVIVSCEVCAGARFTPETLLVKYKERSIADVLAMSVNEATDFFSAHAKIHRALQLLQDVGLGYLRLGQPSPTLSGGEAQRIKLVTELAKAQPIRGAGPIGNHTLYILDEPTIGLHMADVEKLVRVLHRLVDAGNTVLVIEHNLDVVAEADWLIDLGPEGGDGGGRIVAQGAPQLVAQKRRSASHTASALAQFLRQRRRPKGGK